MVRLLCHCMVAIHKGHSSHGRGVPTVLLYGREVATYYVTVATYHVIVATYHVTVWKIPIILLDDREPTMLLYGREVLTRLCMVGMYLPSYYIMGTYVPRLL